MDADRLGHLEEPDQFEPVQTLGAHSSRCTLGSLAYTAGSDGLRPSICANRAHVELYIRQLGNRGLMASSVVTMMHGVRGLFPLDTHQGVEAVHLAPGEPLPEPMGV